MPRISAFIAAAALALAASAASAAPVVTVDVAGDFAKNAESYGRRDVAEVRGWLKQATERALARAKGPPPQRVDLVIEKAVPNRPTFAQLGRRAGLSLHSVGVGGARVSGTVTGADGVVRPVRYQWFESDIRNEVGSTTWSDAERAFSRLAYRIANNDLPERYGPGGGGGDGRFGALGRRD